MSLHLHWLMHKINPKLNKSVQQHWFAFTYANKKTDLKTQKAPYIQFKEVSSHFSILNMCIEHKNKMELKVYTTTKSVIARWIFFAYSTSTWHRLQDKQHSSWGGWWSVDNSVTSERSQILCSHGPLSPTACCWRRWQCHTHLSDSDPHNTRRQK